MEDTSNDEKMDISNEEHAEISAEAEEKTDTAQEDDGVGANSKGGKAMGISDEDFRKFASILKMDMAELKDWFVKSKYDEAEEVRRFFEDMEISDNTKEGKAMGISDEAFSEFASLLQMDMPKLKEWFVKSKYKAEEFMGFFYPRVIEFFEGTDMHPLHVAAGKGEVEMVDMLINEAKVDVNMQVGGITPLQSAALDDLGEMVYMLIMTYGADPNVQNHNNEDRTPLHYASWCGCASAVEGFFRAECELRHPLNVNATNSGEFSRRKFNKINVNATDNHGQTALHLVAYKSHDDNKRDRTLVVQTLLKFPDIKLTIEDKLGRTALDLASKEKNWKVFDVLRLKITSEVTDYNEPYYRDRQASVDAANAILVGAALTFAAWLQPPLGYSTYYNEQYSNSLPAPPTSNPQYASFDHHPALSWFWAFNSLSFFMAIATVMSGAQSVLPPSHRVTVKQEVAKLRRNLLTTSTLLALSMIFVLLAFAIAGVIVVAPVFKLRASMYFTILSGGGVSVWFLCTLVWRIYCTALEMARVRSIREYGVRSLRKYVRKVKFYHKNGYWPDEDDL